MPRTARKPKADTPDLLPPGTLLIDIRVPGRSVPWKAPTVTRNKGTYKDKRLVAWQETVALFARQGAWLREPYQGPVEVWCWFWFSKGPLPDACNCLKGAEDALQGIVFVNDRQVVRNHAERGLWDQDEAFIRVRAAAEPKHGD